MEKIAGLVAILNDARDGVKEVRDLGPDAVAVKPGAVLPFVEVKPDLGAGEVLDSYSDAIGETEVTRTWSKTTPRRLLRKSIVQARLIEAGKMEAAYAALTANATYFARWFAPDRPEVYADDPDALVLLGAIEADAASIMAPE